MPRARCGNKRHAAAATHVNDVERAASFAGELDGHADGFEFSADGAGIEIVADAGASGLLGGGTETVGGLCRTRHGRQRSVRLAARFMPSRKIAGGTLGKSSMPLFDIKAFKAMAPQSRSSSGCRD